MNRSGNEGMRWEWEREKGAAAGWSHPSVPPPLECCLASLRIQNTNNFMLRATRADCSCNSADRGERMCYLDVSHVNHQDGRRRDFQLSKSRFSLYFPLNRFKMVKISVLDFVWQNTKLYILYHCSSVKIQDVYIEWNIQTKDLHSCLHSQSIRWKYSTCLMHPSTYISLKFSILFGIFGNFGISTRI